MPEKKTMKDFWDPDCKTVFVFGAGMEMGNDIGLCSSSKLPASILKYMDLDRNTINVLKKKVKTESFKTIVQKRLNNLFQNKRELSELIEKLERKYPGNDFVVLLSHINSEIGRFLPSHDSDKKQKIVDVNQSRVEYCYEQLQQRYNGLPNVLPDFLIDTDKLAFSQNWTRIIMGLVDVYKDVVAGDNPDNQDEKCLSEILGWVVDYDSLLTESYIGFYTKKQNLKNRYIYLSWLLWAYLADVDRKKEVGDTIYSKLVYTNYFSKNNFVVTLNYSTFLDRALGWDKENERYVHFHGDLAHVINGRTEEKIDKYSDSNSVTKEILDQVFTKGDVIPSMMPPLDIKPLISNQYLERWVKAKNELNDADRIIVVGYSFSEKDDHFNDMIFNAKNVKEIVIVKKDFSLVEQGTLINRFDKDLQKKVRPVDTSAEKFFGFETCK